MSFSPGAHLGPYEILSPLGAGGMGEVYRARDTKLGRDVAIKIVSDGFGHDRERIIRFQREAHLLASLNHPHIAAIYGLEEANGTQFLVLELVEGETLGERLKSGAQPVSEALSIARQIADALQAAHEKGIIHRDLKPPNITFTADGQVKVLDFGLAKELGQRSFSSRRTGIETSLKCQITGRYTRRRTCWGARPIRMEAPRKRGRTRGRFSSVCTSLGL